MPIEPVIDVKKENENEIIFNFYSLKFTPYLRYPTLKSNDVLIKIITYVSQLLNEGKGHLIDRYDNRDRKTEPRELFLTKAIFMFGEKRIKCSMGLLRKGRQPKLKPTDKFKLIPLDSTIGSVAEETHFFIDFNKHHAVICIEFNHFGPRISDVEYYFRNIARDSLKIAKKTALDVYMDSSLEDVLKGFKNLLNLEVKIQPSKLTHLDLDAHGQYFTAVTNLGNKIHPKYIKLEAGFQSPGNSIRGAELNTEANNMAVMLLTKFKNRPDNIEAFENFVIKYESKEGKEEIFNLIKGKKEIVKYINLKELTKLKDWYLLIKEEFDEFMISI